MYTIGRWFACGAIQELGAITIRVLINRRTNNPAANEEDKK